MNQHRLTDRGLAWASRVLAGTVQVGLLATGLTIAAQAQAAGANDAQLQGAVSAALAGDAQLRGQHVSASVSGGVVTLGGSVADDSQMVAAEQTAAGVAGVRSIEDQLSVGGAQTTQADQPYQPATGVSAPSADGTVDSTQAGAPQASSNMPPPPPSESAPQGQYDSQQQRPYDAPGPVPARPGQYAPYASNQYPPPPPPPSYVPGVTAERQNASGPVTLPAGLLVNVRTSEPLSTGRYKGGEFVQFTAASDSYVNGVVAIPRGAVITGQIVESKNAGPLGGSPKLDLKLTTLALGAQTYPLASDVWSSQGPSKSGYTAANTVGGAAFGALIGAIAGGGVGAGIGAAAGGAGGVLVSGATHGPRLDLPAEALLQFHLAAPLTVQPVQYAEAERLAASAPQPQQPVLRQRPLYVRAPYPYYARPYYAYPAPYYYRAY